MKVNKKFITTLIFFMSFFILINGLRIFWIGFHNNDLGFNLKYLACRFNTTLVDTDTNFERRSPNEVIIRGIRQMDIGFYISIIGALLLGFAIGDIHYERR